MITTQNLFDGILTHIRVQGGHGIGMGYDSTAIDGCKCVKGVWHGLRVLGTYWVPGVEDTIGRSLTPKEIVMFDVLEASYENMREYNEFVYNGILPSPQPNDRYMPSEFESTAEKIADSLSIKYTPPNQLPTQQLLKVKQLPNMLTNDIKIAIRTRAAECV